MKLFEFSLSICLLLLVSCQSTDPQPIKSKNHFFVFGGGYSATGNQISLEKNVIYLDSIIEDDAPQSVYRLFADGDKGDRSVQYRLESDFPDEFQELLISCIGSTKRINDQYRPHIVSNTKGALKKAEIDKYFAGQSKSMKDSEKVIVYYTGHGGKGEKKKPWNTGMYLWHDGVYRMKDFVGKLQALPIPAVCVMVQCYSGGFQNMVFKEGDPKKGLAEKPLCGFFSTVHNRVAAGCTPKINDEDYQEYSTWFWAGISGYNRQGKKVVKPDYDNDGFVSFDEAHCYTLINLDSIDVPTKTSEAILRNFTPKNAPKLGITQNSEMNVYLSLADPGQKEVLKKLSIVCGVDDKTKITDLAKKIKDVSAKMKKLKAEYEKNKKSLSSARSKAGKAVRYHYPEFYNPLHASCRKILENQADELKLLLKDNKAFNDFKSKFLKYKKLKEKSSELEMQWVMLQRLHRNMYNILSEPYFLKNAKPEVKKGYLGVRALEKGHL